MVDKTTPNDKHDINGKVWDDIIKQSLLSSDDPKSVKESSQMEQIEKMMAALLEMLG